MPAVMFKGIERVLKAYESRAVPVWALFLKSDMITKGNDHEELSNFLQTLSTEGVPTIYTLKVYEDHATAKTVKQKTDADGSFSFVLNEEYDGSNPQYFRQNNALFQKIDTLEKKIAAIGQAEEPDTLQSVGIDLLRNPTDMLGLVNVFNAIVGRPLVAVPGEMGALGNASNGTDEERQVRAANAIDTLEKKDPKLVEHLEQLAAIAERDPEKFQNLLSMLQMFNR